MVAKLAEDYEGADGARNKPGASCAAAAIGHGCGGGWEVARGKMRPFFAKFTNFAPNPHFQRSTTRC